MTERQDTSLLGRWAMPEKIARPILWLASDEGSFITGAALMVDGGLSIIWGAPIRRATPPRRCKSCRGRGSRRMLAAGGNTARLSGPIATLGSQPLRESAH